jgi:hypothetical protein
MEHRAPFVSSLSMKRTPSSPATILQCSSSSKRTIPSMKRKLTEPSGSSRRGGGAKRGHSISGLSCGSAASSISYLPSNDHSKKLRRSISWDVRPPKVYEPKERCKEKLDDQNEVWYSVSCETSYMGIVRCFRLGCLFGVSRKYKLNR